MVLCSGVVRIRYNLHFLRRKFPLGSHMLLELWASHKVPLVNRTMYPINGNDYLIHTLFFHLSLTKPLQFWCIIPVYNIGREYIRVCSLSRVTKLIKGAELGLNLSLSGYNTCVSNHYVTFIYPIIFKTNVLWILIGTFGKILMCKL